MNGLVIAIIGGLGGMVGWGLADLFAKKTIDQIGDIKSLAWGHIWGTIILFLTALFEVMFEGHAFTFPNKISTWLYLIFFGILQAIIYLFLYKGFGKGQVAILNPVFASFTGLTAILSIIFLGEKINLSISLSLLVIFIGVILMSMDFGALKARKFNFSHVPGIGEVAIATILAALWTLFWNIVVDGQDWIFFALYMYFFMTITILLIAKKQKISLGSIPGNIWKYLIFIGLGEVVAYLAISYAYSISPYTSVIALISGAFSLPTIFLARIFLKERTTSLQLYGSLLIVAGIILLSLV